MHKILKSICHQIISIIFYIENENDCLPFLDVNTLLKNKKLLLSIVRLLSILSAIIVMVITVIVSKVIAVSRLGELSF